MENNNIPKIRVKKIKGIWRENKVRNIVTIFAGGDIDKLKLRKISCYC